jgi:hypothetical protein
MNRKERIVLYEKRAAILERVATGYAESSAEYGAIREAAIALWFGLTQQSGDFLEYLERWDRGELNPEERAHWRSMGINPECDADGEAEES